MLRLLLNPFSTGLTCNQPTLRLSLFSLLFSCEASATTPTDTDEPPPALTEAQLGQLLLRANFTIVTLSYSASAENVEFHTGIDYRADTGTTVYSPIAGEVEIRDEPNGLLTLRIPGTERFFQFLHLSKILLGEDVKSVEIGDPVAESGSTKYNGYPKDRELDPHLHVELREERKTPADPNDRVSYCRTLNPLSAIPSTETGLGRRPWAWYTFDNESAADASGRSRHGTIHGSPNGVSGRISRALQFGGGDYVDIPDQEFHTLTVSCFVKIDAFPRREAFTVDAWRDAERFRLGLVMHSGVPRFHCVYNHWQGKTSFGSSNEVISDFRAERDRWYHIAMTYDGGTLASYVDGELIGIDRTDFSSPRFWPDDKVTLPDIQIAQSRDSGSLRGSIDEVRIYDFPLSAEEVAGLAGVAAEPLADHRHDSRNGRRYIANLRATPGGQFGFTFSTDEPNSTCVVSWTRDFQEWFPLVSFRAVTEGTELIDTPRDRSKIYRITCLEEDVEVADYFDFPIGEGMEVSENIEPEGNDPSNDLYDENPVTNPVRMPVTGFDSSGKWFNYNDVGNYVSRLTDGTEIGGLHGGEDWNFGPPGEDVAEPIQCVANGKVISIRPLDDDLIYGWSLVVRHVLPNGDFVYSIYNHIAPEGLAGALGEESDFLFGEGSSVSRGETIGVIAGIDGSHLHFELRLNVDPTAVDLGTNSARIWKRDIGNGYYGPVQGWGGQRLNGIEEGEVTEAFRLMRLDGIIDPSDFIRSRRQN